MDPDYALESLGPENFEKMAVALCRAALGPGLRVFGDGPDGGREATYHGPIRWSGTTPKGEDSWDGYVVVQAKYRDSPDPSPARNLQWLLSHIKKELDSWTKRDSKRRPFPQYLLLITNARLSAATGGGIESIDAYMQDRYSKELRRQGLRGWRIWHRDDVVSLLVQHEGVRRAFPAFMTNPTDALLQRFESLERFVLPPETRDLLVDHATAAIRNERWINFGEAGSETQRTLDRVMVDLPIRGPDGQYDQALRYLIARGERVLKASLHPKAPRHIVLTGAPGNGKTTIGRYLVQWYRTSFLTQDLGSPLVQSIAEGMRNSAKRLHLPLPRQQRWPIRIDLAEWASSDRGDNYFYRWLAHKVAERAGRPVSVASLRTWMVEWPWLVVFDGLDEVTAPYLRQTIINDINDFIDDVDAADADVFCIVTTRPIGYAGELPSDDFDEVALCYLSASEAVAYGQLIAHTRFGEDQDHRKQLLDRFAKAIEDAGTNRLLKTPLQVLIITFILEQRPTLPNNRYELFWTYYETLLKREQGKTNHLSRFLVERTAEVNFLHETVGALLQIRSEVDTNSFARLTVDELQRIVDERFKHLGYNDDIERKRLTEQMVEAATKRLVLLVPGGKDSAGQDTVMFEVRSLQELMAARRLARDDDAVVLDRLRLLAPSPHWRNTWVFMAGKLFAEPQEARWSLVTALLEHLDSHGDWPGWLIPIAPGIAAELLDDGLSITKPLWQRRLVVTALQALEVPSPIDLALVGRGLGAAAAAHGGDFNTVRVSLREAFSGNEGRRFAASRIVEGSDSLRNTYRNRMVPDLSVNGSSPVKGKHRTSLRSLLESRGIDDLIESRDRPTLAAALAELDLLRVVDVDGELVAVKPKALPDWDGLSAAMASDEVRTALELAIREVGPRHWKLLRHVALEVYPALSRRPRGGELGIDGI